MHQTQFCSLEKMSSFRQELLVDNILTRSPKEQRDRFPEEFKDSCRKAKCLFKKQIKAIEQEIGLVEKDFFDSSKKTRFCGALLVLEGVGGVSSTMSIVESSGNTKSVLPGLAVTALFSAILGTVAGIYAETNIQYDQILHDYNRKKENFVLYSRYIDSSIFKEFCRRKRFVHLKELMMIPKFYKYFKFYVSRQERYADSYENEIEGEIQRLEKTLLRVLKIDSGL